MGDVLDFGAARKLRILADRFKEDMKLIQQGRTPGKSQPLDNMVIYKKQYYPLDIEGVIKMAREARDAPYVSVYGKAEDMKKQLPSARVYQFKQAATDQTDPA